MLSKTTVPDIICIYFSPDLQLGCSYFLCVCSDVNICVPLLILPLGSEIENNIQEKNDSRLKNKLLCVFSIFSLQTCNERKTILKSNVEFSHISNLFEEKNQKGLLSDFLLYYFYSVQVKQNAQDVLVRKMITLEQSKEMHLYLWFHQVQKQESFSSKQLRHFSLS